MELQIKTLTGTSAKGSVVVSDAVFDRAYNEGLVHQVVVSYAAGARQGSKAQKSRSDASGGGAKPWRQKGNGKARAGTIRSPIWVGGGVTFAARPRNYEKKLPKKMYRAAMASIVSQLIREDRLTVIDQITVAEPKTKLLHDALKTVGQGKTLIIVDAIDRNIELASRNLFHVCVVEAARVEPRSLVGAERVLITSEAMKKLEERLS